MNGKTLFFLRLSPENLRDKVGLISILRFCGNQKKNKVLVSFGVPGGGLQEARVRAATLAWRQHSDR